MSGVFTPIEGQNAPRGVGEHGGTLGLEGHSKFKELLAAGAPRYPIGRFRPRRPGGSGTFSNFELWAPEAAVLGLLAVLAKKFLGALRAQSKGRDKPARAVVWTGNLMDRGG